MLDWHQGYRGSSSLSTMEMHWVILSQLLSQSLLGGGGGICGDSDIHAKLESQWGSQQDLWEESEGGRKIMTRRKEV